ncbi:hypothetical protein GCM10017786_62800 [Amycolatopsis deserti]|uniref:Uncharacterized protein n=1 Tax=Amycolatopsis deserti TaxID=185696 RepID=A0ABQ3JE28_9PSEU|nr:hypothetical protein [Amycolatopsis deserti]GHF20403.1 hypothetical protein GCM10017786_62800 [Amycolatopsis deserti]
MPTVQPPAEHRPERHRIVLDGSFYAVEPAPADEPPPVRPVLDRAVAKCARVWRVVLLGLTAVSALAMIAFALMKAVPSTALCMLALVVVKIADHIAEPGGRRAVDHER